MNPLFSGWRSYAFVELPVLLFFFGQTITSAITMQVLIERSCRRITESEDGHISEALNCVDNVLMYKSFIDALIPAILSIFLGTWSDRRGRKPLLVAAYAGSAISFLLWTILCTQKNVSSWLFLVASLPSALVGGYYSLMLASYCFIVDIRPASDRAWHMAWLQSVVSIAQLLGFFIGPYIYIRLSFAVTFGIASAANVIATLYVLASVPESVTRTNEKRSCCSLFDYSMIKDLFLTCGRKLDGFDRVSIWCCVCVLALNMLIGKGESNIVFLFVSNVLHWSFDDYGWLLITLLALSIVGTLIGGGILKLLIDKTMSNMLIAILANVSGLAGSMVKAFTHKSWHFTSSNILGMFGGLSGPVVRTALSKSAPANEIGKVFSLTMLMEALIPFAAAPIYTKVYGQHMTPVYPSPVHLLSVGLYVFIIIIVKTIGLRISRLPQNPPETAINQGVK